MLMQAIASVLEQDLRELQIIVVDDGSTDGTADAIAGIDTRICYIRQPNRRRGYARNRGLEEAEGTFVSFLDDDDLYEPWHISQATEAIRAGATAVSAPVAMWDPVTGKTKDMSAPARAWNNPAAAALDGMVFPLPSLVIPRRLALSCGGFPEEGIFDGSEDLVFLIRLTALCSFRPVHRRSVLIRDHPDRGMKDYGYIIESRKAATELLVREGRAGRSLSPGEACRLRAGCHRFCAALLYQQGRMAEARLHLAQARPLLSRFDWVRRMLLLYLQTYLGPVGSRGARRVKRALTWR